MSFLCVQEECLLLLHLFVASGDHFSVRCWKQVVGAEVSGGNHTVTEGPSLFPLLWAMLCYALLDAAVLSAITPFLVHRRYFFAVVWTPSNEVIDNFSDGLWISLIDFQRQALLIMTPC